MADSAIGEEELVAWIDGELEGPEAERVARAVAENPALAARAEAHRRLASRLQAAFAPIAEEPVALRVAPPAPVVSLAEERARRGGPPRRWALPGAIAASLLVGVLVGHQTWGGGAGVADRADALALAAPIGHALDTQLSGASGPVRIQLSFRDQAGDYCRSFTARHFGGVACRADGGWR
ncbi:MAG TPA: anti-sigma factor, partial [Sphingomonas sp.]|nr:anti-sigma factor [Sphingomonas sp.]